MILTTGLTKKYNNFIAVRNLNLTVRKGERYGFLGPNGAGKTTTLLMILGVIQPTKGNVQIDGSPVRSDSFALKRRIGVVAEYQTFYENMTAWEYIMFFARLFEAANPINRANYLFDRLELGMWKNTLIRNFSTGMKKKLGFIRAMIHSPELLILDEPVSGLDPFGIIQVRKLLMEEKESGTTMVISSHILSEVEQIADRVGIISKGELILEDTMENIRQIVEDGDKISLEFTNLDEARFEKFGRLPFVLDAQRDGNQVSLLTRNDQDYRGKIGAFILAENLVPVEIKRSESSLEDVFVRISETSLRGIKSDEIGGSDG